MQQISVFDFLPFQAADFCDDGKNNDECEKKFKCNIDDVKIFLRYTIVLKNFSSPRPGRHFSYFFTKLLYEKTLVSLTKKS